MNTRTVLSSDRTRFQDALWRLMFEDGFGFDEALDHVRDYALIIFNNTSKTALLRVRAELNRLARRAMES